MTADLPVAYRFGALVVRGRGFAAQVRTQGHAVASLDPSGIRLASVGAGGLEGSGEDLHEAFEDLRVRLSSALFAVASSAEDYDAFVASARELLRSRDAVAARRFDEAVALIAFGTGGEAPPAPDADAIEVSRLDRPETELVPAPTPADAVVALDRRSLRESAPVASERRSA